MLLLLYSGVEKFSCCVWICTSNSIVISRVIATWAIGIALLGFHFNLNFDSPINHCLLQSSCAAGTYRFQVG